MICTPCADRNHGECPGGTWCECQHQPPRTVYVPYARTPDAPRSEEIAAGIDITGHVGEAS
jgi:hypothetical protein